MPEVQHQQQTYQGPTLNGHQAAVASINNGQSQDPQQQALPTSNPSVLPPLQQVLEGKPQQETDGNLQQKHLNNPIHPNAKTTTHVSANGSTTSKTTISAPICKNCKTSTTPLWRRDESGQVLCNACGLFLKLHGRPRPISLKTDVIKSRNRVKNSHNNNSSGSSPSSINSKNGSDVPELKAKDSKKSSSKKEKHQSATSSEIQLSSSHNELPQSFNHAQDAETQQDSQTSPALAPLLPRGQASTGATTTGKSTPNFFPQFHHLPPHLQHQTQQQVPLHHPSSVPTQFASNLQKITSPLLLSTTPKQHVPVSHLAQAHAAAALENLSHSKPTASDLKELQQRSSSNNNGEINAQPFSPATALNGNNGLLKPTAPAPKLPSLIDAANSNFYSSPSFGPQHSLTNPSAFSLSNPTSSINNSNSSMQLPLPSSGELPSLSSSKNSASSNTTTTSESSEVARLKIRISELELVNDLYKSRIQELESLELQREQQAKKRIDEQNDEQTRKKLKLEDNNNASTVHVHNSGSNSV